MRKRRLFTVMVSLCLALVLLATLSIACAKKEAPPTITPVVPAEVRVLKVGDWHLPKIPAVIGQCCLLREFARRSGGRIELEEYFSGTLAGGKELLSATRTGVADAAAWHAAYNLGEAPMAGITCVPAIIGTTWSAIMAFNRCLEDVPELEQEFLNNNVIYLGGTGNPSCNIISTKPIRSLDDLKGLKINASGHQQTLLAEFGVPPTSLISTEVYEAMMRGTLDGNVNNPEWARVYSFHEPGKYWYNIPCGGFLFFTIMNKDVFDSLPQDLQDMLVSMRDEQAEAQYMIYDIASDLRARQIMYESLEVIDPPASDVERFIKVAEETVWADWIQGIEAEGLPGEETFDRWLYWNEYYSEQEHPTYISSMEDRAR